MTKEEIIRRGNELAGKIDEEEILDFIKEMMQKDRLEIKPYPPEALRWRSKFDKNKEEEPPAEEEEATIY